MERQTDYSTRLHPSKVREVVEWATNKSLAQSVIRFFDLSVSDTNVSTKWAYDEFNEWLDHYARAPNAYAFLNMGFVDSTGEESVLRIQAMERKTTVSLTTPDRAYIHELFRMLDETIEEVQREKRNDPIRLTRISLGVTVALAFAGGALSVVLYLLAGG